MALLLSGPALAADGVKINELVIAAPISDAQRDATVKAARAFYDFWNTGDETLLKQAIAENFTDRTLPPGRPQGPEGPAFASRQFRAAVPDLKATVEKMIVAGDYVTVHMSFTGHFTGTFAKAKGEGLGVTFAPSSALHRGAPIHDRGQRSDAPRWSCSAAFATLKALGRPVVQSHGITLSFNREMQHRASGHHRQELAATLQDRQGQRLARPLRRKCAILHSSFF
jgi:predicted ester cyclase